MPRSCKKNLKEKKTPQKELDAEESDSESEMAQDSEIMMLSRSSES